MLALILSAAVVSALTELQVDELIDILKSLLEAVGSGVQTVWNLLSPILLAYLAFRQAQNRKALDDNTKVSTDAFAVANGHNEKIAEAVKISKGVLEIVKPPALPVVQEVHVTNDASSPIPPREA